MLAKSVQAKLMAIVIGGIAILLLVSIGSIVLLVDKIQEYETLVSVEVKQEQDISKLNLSFQSQVQAWKNLLIRGGDPALFEQYWTEFSRLQIEVRSASEALLAEMVQSKAYTCFAGI